MAESWFAQYHIPRTTPAASEDKEETPAGSITPKVTDFTPETGGKPAVPDPTAVLRDAIAANLAMMGDIKGLGAKASKYFWNQTVGRVPGYEDMAAQSAKNIGSMLRGEVPADVLYNLGQGAAERGITRGGGFSNADYLRSLGLTSLGLMGEGEKGLTGALQRAESIPLFDISKYMLSPQEIYNAMFQANVIGAAPDPAAARADALNTVNQASKTTGGLFQGAPALGGGKGLPAASNIWAQQWAPTGDVGGTGAKTTTDTYSPWGTSGWMGGAGVPSYSPTGYQEGTPAGHSIFPGEVEGPGEGTGEGLSSDFLDQLLWGGIEDFEWGSQYDPLAGMY